MKFIHFLFSSVLILILSGCGDKELKTFPLTVIITEPIGSSKIDKFPEIYNKLCNSITTTKNIQFNLAPYPVIIKRLGIDKGEVKLDIIADNRKSNTNNINYRNNMIIKFFEENTIGTILSMENIQNFNKAQCISNFISSLGRKDKIFFYNQNAQSDSIYSQRLYSDIDSVKYAIILYLGENPSNNIYVILNPQELPKNPSPNDSIDKKYKKIIVMADSALKIKNYEVAKNLYSKATTIKPNEKHPKEQIEIIIKILDQRNYGSSGTGSKKTKENGLCHFTYPFGEYNGYCKNGLPCGDGTMIYTKNHTVSKTDSRIVLAGDKIVGFWVKGEISNGKWYNDKGEEKEKIYNGTTGGCD